MNRRNVLLAGGATLSFLFLSGCVSDVPKEAAQAVGDGDPRTKTVPEENAMGPTRGESDAAVTVREVEDREYVEYLPEHDVVRHVAEWRHTDYETLAPGENPDAGEYETIPFGHWATRRCAFAAAGAAAEHVRAELGVTEKGAVTGGVSSSIADEQIAAVVETVETYDRDGDLLYETDVEFETLVEATPRTVTATYVLDGRERTVDVPIYARHTVLQQS
ncbi:hypothetical protein ACFQJC_04605 [Haloferax namakaokahaiae]|uniref:Lipoprotein n=1 Tax=Haloferax namakaokahaiae TaxID=1748331 RepID=A0ABD5ZC63_9EURY